MELRNRGSKKKIKKVNSRIQKSRKKIGALRGKIMKTS
jgi:hypothetical protein